MTSKEMVLQYLKRFKVGGRSFGKTFESKMFNAVLKDLDRLEKLKKENQELKEKNSLITKSVESDADNYLTIKQYILKAQKKEEALKVIKEKGIDYHSISAIKQSKDYEDYLDLVKNLITLVFKLTKKEYELLKEVLEDGNMD